MPSERVKCWARIRPTNKFSNETFKIQPDLKTLNVFSKDYSTNSSSNPIGVSWSFPLDGVLHNASQETLYDAVVKETACHVFAGYNGCVMCYGQTGSGKTFTMTGLAEDFENRGITPRAIHHAFQQASCDPSRCYQFMVSYVQIYNETIYDLLSTSNHSNDKNNKSINNNNCNNNNEENENYQKTEAKKNQTNDDLDNIKFNTSTNVNNNCCNDFTGENNKVKRLRGVKIKEMAGCVLVPHLKVLCVSNEDEALNLLFEGEVNRAIAAHKLNSHSSRSHCIFTIYVQSSSLVESDAGYRFSKLHLVDLAGSERIKKTNVSEGKIRQEASYINKSLVFLEQVVIAASRRRGGHIPFRQSKLTHYLKDSIGGACRVLFIANVYGDSKHTEETVSTLRFAMTMMRVPVYPVVQNFIDPMGRMKELCMKVMSLKGQLSVQDALVGRTGQSYEEPNENERETIRKKTMLYLNGQLDDLEITGLMQVKEILKYFKEYQKESKEQLEEEYQQRYIMLDKTDPEVLQRAVQAGFVQAPPDYVAQALQTIERTSKNVSARKEASDVKNPENNETSKSGNEEEEEEEEEDEEGGEGEEKVCKENAELVGFKKVTIKANRNDEFEMFKLTDGKPSSMALFRNKELLKASRQEYRLMAQEVNRLKGEVDESASRIKCLQALDHREGIVRDPMTGERVVTETEFDEVEKLKCLKKQYRERHARLLQLQEEVNKARVFVHQNRLQLLHEFDFWFLQKHPQSEC